MRLKDIVEINRASLPETTNPNYTFRYIDISNISSEGTICLSDEMKFSESPSRARRIVKKGDVLVSTVRTYLRAIGCINGESNDLIASTGFAVCTPKESANNRFLEYAIRTDDVINSICKNSTGVSYPAITASCLGSITVPFYSLVIQNQIVNYLDEKVKSIKNRISILTKQRDAFTRLETSIINRAVTQKVGKNRRIKNIVSLITTPSHDYHKIGLENIESGTGRYFTSNSVFEGNGTHFMSGDLVYGKLRPYLKKVWLATFEGNAVGDFFVFRPSSETFPNYIKWLFLSEWFTQKANNSTFGAKMPRVSSEFILSLPIVFPSIEEQQAIATYLDEKCAKIDTAIANIDKQIDALKRLKRALINEVVTGKREV